MRLKEIACAGVYKASHRRGNESDHVVKIDCIHVIVASLVYTQENASVDNTTGPLCNPFFLVTFVGNLLIDGNDDMAMVISVGCEREIVLSNDSSGGCEREIVLSNDSSGGCERGIVSFFYGWEKVNDASFEHREKVNPFSGG